MNLIQNSIKLVFKDVLDQEDVLYFGLISEWRIMTISGGFDLQKYI